MPLIPPLKRHSAEGGNVLPSTYLCPPGGAWSEVGGGGTPLLRLLQVSFGLQVSLEEGEQAEVLAAVTAAVRRLSAVDAAVPHEAGGQVEALGAEGAAVRFLPGVGVPVVPQQLLQTVALPTDVAVERFLPRVAPLVNLELRRVGELLVAHLAGDDGVSGRQLVGRELVRVFADDVVLQAAVGLAADGAQLTLSGVDRLVTAQVGGLGEALPASGTLVRPHVLVHQLVARQVAGVVEAFAADVADEGLVEVGHPVRLQHANAGVALAADVAVAGLLPSVPRLHVQVAVRFVVEPLGAVVTGVRQQPVLFVLMLAEPQDTGEECPAHRACRVRLLLVVVESLCIWKQHPAPQTQQVSLCPLRRVSVFLLPAAAPFLAARCIDSALLC